MATRKGHAHFLFVLVFDAFEVRCMALFFFVFGVKWTSKLLVQTEHIAQVKRLSCVLEPINSGAILCGFDSVRPPGRLNVFLARKKLWPKVSKSAFLRRKYPFLLSQGIDHDPP